MFVVEVLASAFNVDSMLTEQSRNTRYFDNIDEAMADYQVQNAVLTDYAKSTTEWDIIIISIFGKSDLLKMQTIRCRKEK